MKITRSHLKMLIESYLFEDENDDKKEYRPITSASPITGKLKKSYEIVKKLYIIESRHYYQSIGAPIPIRFKLASISGYNRWRNTIQYVTLFITFLSNIFKSVSPFTIMSSTSKFSI